MTHEVGAVIAPRGRDDLEAEQSTLQRTLRVYRQEVHTQIIPTVWRKKRPHIEGPASLEEGEGRHTPEGS